MMESGVIYDGKGTGEEESKDAELKKKFTNQGVTLSIANVSSFDSTSLTYIDFLDCLIRLTSQYPFSEEERHAYNAMDLKLSYIIKKLEAKYGNLVEGFVEQLKKKNKEMNYQPKCVVDDEGEDEEDDDEE